MSMRISKWIHVGLVAFSLAFSLTACREPQPVPPDVGAPLDATVSDASSDGSVRADGALDSGSTSDSGAQLDASGDAAPSGVGGAGADAAGG